MANAVMTGDLALEFFVDLSAAADELLVSST
jgi:hypothetical protein